MTQPRVHIRPRRRPELDIIPLGGCGGIGMNLTLYGFEGRWIAVDCGMALRQDLPDTPLQIPDIASVTHHGIRPEAILITHGHEDHIGALSWLWPHWGCPIHASPLATEMLKHKFADKGLSTTAIRTYRPGDSLEIPGFEITTIPVTHSIPESCALLLQTRSHRILHTGDWKLDPAPVLGTLTDEAALQALAPIGLVTGDSTNATVAGLAGSEADVAQALTAAVAACQKRVVVSCFASNLARIASIGRTARISGRRIALMGRAMERMVRLARTLGYFDEFPDIIPLRDVGYLPPEEVLLIATGSQGEPRAALSKLAMGRHPEIELEAGDSVIFSSRTIPGNETAVARLQNALRQRGIRILDEHSHPELHVSGHPAREELTRFYSWVKPATLLPVHGEPQHQQSHVELATQLGINAPLIPVNGDWLKWDGRQLRCDSRLPLETRLIQNRSNPGTASPETALTVILPITMNAGYCERRGRLLLDGEADRFTDELALSDWIDDCLAQWQVADTDQLYPLLAPRLEKWISRHSGQFIRTELNVVKTG
ncbi:ribonuclease J [Kushneria sinocarnis]|uniref:Ribonuclease J n=1 Tax=Kushneria sinocarnis TaxID=595502 RepID=A0A420WXX8_9GAMM|nr:ribonuclease J [Kushneria sinocarnis]RKR06038.1 ribonuclease J [Kushneria sinocarnis]